MKIPFLNAPPLLRAIYLHFLWRDEPARFCDTWSYCRSHWYFWPFWRRTKEDAAREYGVRK